MRVAMVAAIESQRLSDYDYATAVGRLRPAVGVSRTASVAVIVVVSVAVSVVVSVVVILANRYFEKTI